MRRDDRTPRDPRLLEAVCRNATGALFVLDERRHCVYMNPAAEALTGYMLEEAGYAVGPRPAGVSTPAEGLMAGGAGSWEAVES